MPDETPPETPVERGLRLLRDAGWAEAPDDREGQHLVVPLGGSDDSPPPAPGKPLR